jgi:hypothetical protein
MAAYDEHIHSIELRFDAYVSLAYLCMYKYNNPRTSVM